jgi:hypothetical protein
LSSGFHAHDDDFIIIGRPGEALWTVQYCNEPTTVYLCACGHNNIHKSLVCLSCERIESVDAELIRIARATEIADDIAFLREMGVRYDE